ncbi:hypothetical protein BO94DRAFT_41335 [Aspergillus sclerotioniger CBS 115572]|uniref:Gag1-like clamp domain-containing protein n=1 Tax=Aspergillus sclerotioniger CBS 115572 TaxID=1450535 RepID=A0A317WT42_9EURO|nr:hypothetical protein BO94DRAFT_41335 [Aspergillus sclerotioniger CBS 115572]PWY89574.1 hypothetical protein BO94DRAFT_41335 [Aspergillus sclerotioniger CBS 115572]
MSTTEARDAAIRDAKRYVRDTVRNDWVFEPSAEPGAPPFSSPPTPEQDVLEWRLREYDSSGSELEPQSSPTIGPAGGQQHPGYNPSELSSPLGTPLGDDSDRRRKRRRQMEEEMQWNQGLRVWVERRDAWSGALSKEEIRARESKTQQTTAVTPTASSSEQPQNVAANTAAAAATLPLSSSPSNSQNELALRTEASLSIAENDGSLPRPPSRGEEPSTAAEQPPPPPPAGDDAQRETTTSAETLITEPDSTHQPSSEDPLIPVVPSLISNTNPVRASITPAMYPSIYSKVVVQGLTPTVPINLADVTKAMVQGWKSDGQWPPKPTSIVLQDTATVRRKPEESAAADKPPSSPESKRRSGVASAVRKVFHFSGFHPHHPFHRRGSSSQQNDGGAGGADGGVNT